MTILALFILALGLSMDSFAVSLSSGVALKPFKFVHVAKIAFFLSFFQAVMPILGWLLGVGFVNIIQSVDHWIAFALLLFLGGKMIFDGLKNETEDRIIIIDNEKEIAIYDKKQEVFYHCIRGLFDENIRLERLKELKG